MSGTRSTILALTLILCVVNCYISNSLCDSDMRDLQRTVIDLAEWQLHDVWLNGGDVVAVEADDFG